MIYANQDASSLDRSSWWGNYHQPTIIYLHQEWNKKFLEELVRRDMYSKSVQYKNPLLLESSKWWRDSRCESDENELVIRCTFVILYIAFFSIPFPFKLVRHLDYCLLMSLHRFPFMYLYGWLDVTSRVCFAYLRELTDDWPYTQ